MTSVPKADPVRLARAYLVRVAEPPAPRLVELVEQEGPIRAAELVRRGAVTGDGVRETAARRHLDLASQDVAAAGAVGARLIIPEDEDWPGWQLLALRLAGSRGIQGMAEPLALWVRGAAALSEVVDRSVSVVGARSASGYGEQVAGEFGYGLAARQVTVVSGAAYGIDGSAHRGALGAGGLTVAVLGSGIDVGYPAGHAGLLRAIAEQGLVISEHPPGTPPARHRFLVRNRLIAALGAGAVVVEAGRRSGAHNTASTARVLGRTVMAVPGPVTSAMSVGCHQLLRSGEAIAVTTVDEVVETIGRVGADLAPRQRSPARATDGLDRVALQVHEALSTRAEHSDEWTAVQSGVPLERVRALLCELELLGLAQRGESGWRRAAGPSARTSPGRCGGS
ncbi:MAG: DNA-protecting protein DprA [Kutzneria sp.]|nr:DNA-protecting protein DprA [Kutzneria sp.]